MLGDDDKKRAIEALAYHIEYYKGIDCIITKIKFGMMCKMCSGNGTVFVPSKRNKFLGKNVRCPECKGKNSDTIILEC